MDLKSTKKSIPVRFSVGLETSYLAKNIPHDDLCQVIILELSLIEFLFCAIGSRAIRSYCHMASCDIKLCTFTYF